MPHKQAQQPSSFVDYYFPFDSNLKDSKVSIFWNTHPYLLPQPSKIQVYFKGSAAAYWKTDLYHGQPWCNGSTAKALICILVGRGQGRDEGWKGVTIPWATNHCRERVSTSFNKAHFFPKDLRFEHGGAKLASCPGRHLTSLRLWLR